MNNQSDEGTYDDFVRHLMSSLEATRIQAKHLGQSALNNPLGTAGDFMRGAANGAIQAPFDLGAFIAPAMGMIAPVGASTLQPLAKRTQSLLDQSPLGTTSDAGAIGNLLANLLLPLPGGGKLAGARKLSDLAGLIKP